MSISMGYFVTADTSGRHFPSYGEGPDGRRLAAGIGIAPWSRCGPTGSMDVSRGGRRRSARRHHATGSGCGRVARPVLGHGNGFPARECRATVPARAAVDFRRYDVERGYVDVAAAYRVSSNDPSGYMVRLAPRIGLTRSVEVAGLSSPIVMTDQVVEVDPARGAAPATAGSSLPAGARRQRGARHLRDAGPGERHDAVIAA